MPTCIVIDDEKLARERIVHALESHSQWHVIGQAAEFQEAEELVCSLIPDVCFVDINLIGGSGVALVESLRSSVNTLFVFTTAYSEFASKAFELDVCDYLLKPFDNERFADVLTKLEKRLVNRYTRHREILAVRSIGSVQFINVNDIIWIKGSANYVELHCQDKMLLHRETLSNLENQLDRRKFARVHRSAMVNLEKIESLNSELGRFSLLQLSNGDEVKISPTHKSGLFCQLGIEVHS
jgi:two-component system LytT family response regulator